MAKSKGFALTEAISNTLCKGLVNVSDTGAAYLTLHETFMQTVGKIKGLRGKPLPDADVARIGDTLRVMYAKRVEAGTVKDTSVKSLVSTALKVAKCSPVLASMDNATFLKYCRNWTETRAYCTALKAANYKLADVKIEDAKSDPIRRGASAIKGILKAKSKHKLHSKGCKAAFALLASRANVNLGSAGEEWFSREEALAFLGLK